MAWICVNKNKTEVISSGRGLREEDGFWSFISDNVIIPYGTIRNLIGRELTWSDEPVELTGEELQIKEVSPNPIDLNCSEVIQSVIDMQREANRLLAQNDFFNQQTKSDE